MSENGSQKVFVPGLFERAKEVRFDVVLAELGLLDQLKVAGDEIRGKCPLCKPRHDLRYTSASLRRLAFLR